jgi:hypothetical protein
LSHYFSYDVYKDDRLKGSAYSKSDICKFYWQATNDLLITFDVCKKSITELKAVKTGLEKETIDSIVIFSHYENRAKKFTGKQVEHTS